MAVYMKFTSGSLLNHSPSFHPEAYDVASQCLLERASPKPRRSLKKRFAGRVLGNFAG